MPGLRIDPFRGAFVTLCPAELIRFDLEHRVQRVLDARPDRLVNVALELPFVNLDRALQSLGGFVAHGGLLIGLVMVRWRLPFNQTEATVSKVRKKRYVIDAGAAAWATRGT